MGIDLSYKDLPDELLNEILEKEKDHDFLQVIKLMPDQFSINDILVGYYRVHSKTLKRNYVANKCYRMTKKKVLKHVKGKRGIYERFENDTKTK